MRVAVVGDVHAHKDELLKLLALIEAKRVDEVIFLGDLVDRGPDPFGCVDLVRRGSFKARSGRRKPFKAIRGNHEDGYCRAAMGLPKPGETEPARAGSEGTLRGLSDEEIEWMWSLPVKLRVSELNLLLVHGGILPSMRTEAHLDERVMRVRFLDERSGGMLGSFKWSKRFWADEYDGRFGFAVYGHQSFSKPEASEWALGIDGEGRGKMHAAIFTDETKDGRVLYQTLTVDYPEPVKLPESSKSATSMPLFDQLGLSW